MKSVSNEYKEQLTALGRQYKVLVTYTQDNEQVELSNSELNIVTPHYEGDILKSTMKQLDLDSNVDIPIGTELNCQFGLLVGNNYEYIDYGNYIVYSSEKQEDLKSYKIVCYDKMLNAMKDYQALHIGSNLLNINLFEMGGLQNGNKTNFSYRITNANNPIEVKANTQYYVTAFLSNEVLGMRVGVHECDENGTFLRDNNWKQLASSSYFFTTSNTTKYVKMVFSLSTTSTNVTTGGTENTTAYTNPELWLRGSKLQFSETNASVYQPYLQTVFPMSVKDYLTTLSYNLDIPLATQSFVNDSVSISGEKYLDENGNTLGYTYRDVLDDFAQVTASTICINEDDKLEVRYLNDSVSNNLYDYANTRSGGVGLDVTTDEEDYVSIIVDNTSGTGTKWENYFTRKMNIEDSSDYTIVMEVNSVLANTINSNNAYMMITQSFNAETGQFNQYISRNLKDLQNNTIYIFQVTSKANQSSLEDFGLRQYVAFPSGTSGSIKYRISVFKGHNITLENFYYQPFNCFTINETYLKDTNVNFKEKYGPINSVVFSRSGDSDLIYRKDDESIEQNGLCELKIKDNQLLNENDRDNFIDGVFNQLSGLEFYINDYVSTGITILELCDKYNVKVGENIYPCIMFNDELNVTQGFEELVHTDKPDTSESDYKKADTTDRRINQAYLIVDKQNQQITALTSRTNNLATQVNNDKQELLNKFGDYATNSQVQSLTTQVNTIQTDTYTKTEVSQILKGTFYDENNNQVVSEVVKTISGTFDENGMTYAKTNAKTSTTINEIGVRVNNTTSSAELLFAGYDDSISQTIVRTDNLLVRNFLNIGSNSRLQDYETGTGVFDI